MGWLADMAAVVDELSDPAAIARRRVAAALVEEARLIEAALQSGALASEIVISWRYRRGAGIWPTM